MGGGKEHNGHDHVYSTDCPTTLRLATPHLGNIGVCITAALSQQCVSFAACQGADTLHRVM